MTRPASDVERVQALLAEGLNQLQIARRTGIPRSTLRAWIDEGITAYMARRQVADVCTGAAECGRRDNLPAAEYAYLFGQYLGDGCISQGHRRVYRLRIACCDDYPQVMDEVHEAMAAVMPQSKVGRTRAVGCTEIGSSSKHWPCLIPQHGPGVKHTRPIVLEAWQEAIVAVETKAFVRGLIQSDGSRCMNRVQGGAYEYPRYFFSNRSLDIQRLYCDALDRLGIEWRANGPWSISVARRDSVAALDEFVGPKR